MYWSYTYLPKYAPAAFPKKQLPCHNDLEMKQHFLPPGVAHRSGSVSVVSNIEGQSWTQWAILEGKKLSTSSAIGGQNWVQWAILEDQDRAQWAISEGQIERSERYRSVNMTKQITDRSVQPLLVPGSSSCEHQLTNYRWPFSANSRRHLTYFYSLLYIHTCIHTYIHARTKRKH